MEIRGGEECFRCGGEKVESFSDVTLRSARILSYAEGTKGDKECSCALRMADSATSELKVRLTGSARRHARREGRSTSIWVVPASNVLHVSPAAKGAALNSSAISSQAVRRNTFIGF